MIKNFLKTLPLDVFFMFLDPLAESEDLLFCPINKTAGTLKWKASCTDGEPTVSVYNT